MRNIVIYLDHINRYHFFRRLSDALELLDYQPIFLTCRLSLYIRLRFCGKYALLIFKNEKNKVQKNIKSLDIFKGQQTISDASGVYFSVYSVLDEINAKSAIDMFCIWNGSSTCDLAISDFARQNFVKTLYFEIGNFPNKIFVDPKGVNARSWLYKNPKFLDNLPLDCRKFEKWEKNIFETQKSKQPPQIKFLAKVNWFSLVDRLGFYFFGVQRLDRASLYEQCWKIIRRRSVCLNYDSCDLKLPYVFLPLQVSDDSQLLFNSDVDNEQAISLAKEQADLMKMPLVVKHHPVESSSSFLKKLDQLRSELGFILVSQNTIELIDHSSLLVVINSTVGIEGIVRGKSVKVLGKAIYEKFDKKRVISYLQQYLLDYDFFDVNGPMSTSVAKKCLERAEYL